MQGAVSFGINLYVNLAMNFEKLLLSQDFSESISGRSMEKFAYSFMKSGNVNLINDVLKAYHRSRKKISTVNLDFICSFIRRLVFASIQFKAVLFFLFRKSISFFLDSKNFLKNLDLLFMYVIGTNNCFKTIIRFIISWIGFNRIKNFYVPDSFSICRRYLRKP